MPSAHDARLQVLDARLQRFFERRAAGIIPGTGPVRLRLAALDHPERAFPVIHVAGTNGKGSTCAVIERLLREAGLKTGLFTSPHLLRFHERIRVNGEEIGDLELAALAEEVELVDARCEGRPATFFELSTAMAYTHFARVGVDVAVIETGLGGRYDATNVIDPLVSVITRIGIDHASFLGDRLDQIASEKAGIIKQGRPVVRSPQLPEATLVIEAVAASRFCELYTASDADLEALDVRAWPLAGAHQRENLATAVAATRLALHQLGRTLPVESWNRAIADVHWPARFQALSEDPPTFLDAAHNPDGAAALRALLDERFPGQKVAWIMAFMADKDSAGMLNILRERMDAAWLVPLEMARAADADTLQALVPMATVCDLPLALAEGSAWARDAGAILCIAGSLFLAGEVLRARNQGSLDRIACD